MRKDTFLTMFQTHLPKLKRTGFSLTELLIALSVLGIIVAFTVPKWMAVQRENQKRAVFIETMGVITVTLQKAMYQRVIRPTDMDTYALGNFMRDNINTARACADASAQGCWGGAGSYNGLGICLHNGACFIGFDDGPATFLGTTLEDIRVDWNGPQEPNVIGDDTLHVILNFGTEAFPEPGAGIFMCKPGALCPGYGWAGNLELWNTIFINQ